MLKFDTTAFRDAIATATGQIADAVDESSLRAAGFAGAEVFRDEAKRNAAAHRKTGVLEKSIIIKRTEEGSDGNKRQEYVVTVRSGAYGAKGDAFYWRFLEFGTASTPASPFMRPAYESKKQEAAAVMAATLSEAIGRKLRK